MFYSKTYLSGGDLGLTVRPVRWLAPLACLAFCLLPHSAALAQEPMVDTTPIPPDDAPFAAALTGAWANAREILDFSKAPAPSGGAIWIEIGAQPLQFGQTENVSPNNEVSGAVHVIAAHPSNADVLYVGSVNGGLWKSTNASTPSPDWAPLIDDHPSLSIGALEFDADDVTNNTLVAGLGSFSSFGGLGGASMGLLRTTDGGANWTALDGGGTLLNKNISGVVVRGSTIVVSVNLASPFTFGNIGIFRSTSTGASFTQISGTGGLPQGKNFDLVSHPNDPTVLYTVVLDAGSSNGIYKSSDTGATWSRVSDTTMNALILDGITNNCEMAIHDNTVTNAIYVGIINFGQLINGGIFRSGDGGANWTAMDFPLTAEIGGSVGLQPRFKPDAAVPGGQGQIHFSILADPDDPNIVYVGGDRQPKGFNDAASFPNAIGATNFTGRLFRGDASQAMGSQWEHLTHSDSVGAMPGGGTASASAPHADSREMVFDANGNIIETDDGGVYRRTSPLDNTGDWTSMNGNIQVMEIHDIAYDTVANIIIAGTQDVGSGQQSSSGSSVWTTVNQGDGGDVAVDNTSSPGFSIRYASAQTLLSFRRITYNSSGFFVSQSTPDLVVLSGGAGIVPGFVTPVVLNEIDPTRLIIQASNSVYESLDQGDTVTEIGPGLGAGFNQNAVAYGGSLSGAPNEDVLYVGSGDQIFIRTTPGGSFVESFTSWPGTEVTDIELATDDWMTAYVIDAADIRVTDDAGASWTDITGNLTGVGRLWCLEYIENAVDGDFILVGSDLGVFISRVASLGTWNELGTNLPNAIVRDMAYDTSDDLLVVGTMGRGAWMLENASLAGGTPPPPAQAPVVTTTSADLQYQEGDGAVAVDSGVTVTDSDDTDLVGATVSISAGFNSGEDTLAFVNMLGISGSFSAVTGELTLSGTASVGNYQTALRSVTYLNPTDNPDETTRTVTFEADDGTDTGSDVRDIQVSSVNITPVINSQAGTLSTMEETAITLAVTDLVVTDADNTFPDDFTLQVLDGANYTVSATMVTPSEDFVGTLTIPVTVDDGVGGAAKATSVSFDMTVTVTAVNDIPVITGQAPLSTNEDDSIALVITNVSVDDPDNVFPGDFTLTVLDGEDYTRVGNTVTPDLDFDGFLSVPVTVNDGVAKAESPIFDMTITVIPMNDTPVITGQTSLSANQGEPFEITLSALIVDDPDDDFPIGFTLTVMDGDDYTRSGNTITPDSVFRGTLRVPLSVDDGNAKAESPVFDLEVSVVAINDPVITGQFALSTPEETSITIELTDLAVVDANNVFPDDFTLTVMDGDNYTRVGNTVTPDMDFTDILSVPVIVNDGVTDSNVFIVLVSVLEGNSAPTDLTLDNASVSEQVPAGRVVGTLTAIDEDVDDTHRFFLVAGAGDTDNDKFAIDGNNLTTGVVLDMATQTTASIRLLADDSRGGAFEKQFTITITEGEETLCTLFPAILNQYANFLALGPVPDDIDNDDIPEEFTLALIEAIACMNNGTSLWGATLNAFDINLTVLDDEFYFGLIAAFRELIAVLMVVGQDTQAALDDIMTLAFGIELSGTYEIVTCESLSDCVPAEIPGLALKDGYEVFEAGAKAFNEPYSGNGNLDGDLSINRVEFDAVIDAGGSVGDYVIAAIDPDIDAAASAGTGCAPNSTGLPFVSDSPMDTAGDLLLMAMAALGLMSLGNVGRGRKTE